MDKLRALTYLIAAADEGSFAAAARRLQVSTPAVAKMIGSLERTLGVALFQRGNTGLSLTEGGRQFIEACREPLEELAIAEKQISEPWARTSGTVVVAVQPALALNCLMPARAQFHRQNPRVKLDMREFTRTTPEQMNGVDVFLVIGWPQVADLVHKQIGRGRFVVCAAPQYWASRGVPNRPQDLAAHDCLPARSVDGTLMDLWRFQRGNEQESVTIDGWLITNNAQRDVGAGAAIAGAGVVRTLDVLQSADIAAGRLVPVPQD